MSDPVASPLALTWVLERTRNGTDDRRNDRRRVKRARLENNQRLAIIAEQLEKSREATNQRLDIIANLLRELVKGSPPQI